MLRTHQLVFQFDAARLHNYDDLISLDSAVEKRLPEGSVLDGHDHGLGEYNVFIHTNDPVLVFQIAREEFGKQYPDVVFSAGYRRFNEDEYTVLWPTTATKFAVS